MSYPVDLFVPTHTYAIEPGELVFDEGLYSLAVRVQDDRDEDTFFLRLQGDSRFKTQYPGAHRKCCKLNPKYRLVIKVSGTPKTVERAYEVGQLIFAEGQPGLIVSQIVRNETLAYSLAGEQRDLRFGVAVAWTKWELWLVDSDDRAITDTPFMELEV